MSKLNAFLAAVPANGLPSPTPSKTIGMLPNKAFPSLSIPQIDSDADGASLKVAQPATPQPARRLGRNGHGSVRDIARRFDSQRALAIDGTNEDPAGGNQEDVDELKKSQPVPLPPTSVQATTPAKKKPFAAFQARSGSLEDLEAGPLKRLNVTQQLQQQHQSQHPQHHRRISTDTAMFSKLLKKQPDQDIDIGVVQYFTELAVPTISRPEQDSNQVEEDNNNAVVQAIDPAEIMAGFKRGETVSVTTALAIIQQAACVMTMEPNVVVVRASITLVGDLHGQFSDLVEIFNVHGMPSTTNPFLFLGDYVDRGVASCEIILLLLALKIRFPTSIYLLRGNHECRSLSTFYGFRAECLKKYGLSVYNRMIKCFESMPLAAKITTAYGVFLAVHGGLSPSIKHIDEINDKVNRFMEPDPSGALCDLLWSDPAKDTCAQDEPFAPNRVRGCSYTFNEHVCREFLANNGLLAIIRAHELEEDGFKEHFITPGDERQGANEDDELSRLPPVITVFSAPEYCNINHNMGATLLIPWDKQSSNSGDKLLTYRQHKRSAQREAEFSGVSEYDAVQKYLSEQLPFLPMDFYDLVVVCRQLRATLEVAASITTPVPSSASNVLQEKSATGSELLVIQPSIGLPPRPPVTNTNMNPRRGIESTGRRSVDHTSTQADDAAPPATGVIPPSQSPDARSTIPRRRASTGSGLRLCPGFMRFCEKFLGMRFDGTESKPAPRVVPDKKRRSIDDIQIGTSSPTKDKAVAPATTLAEIHVIVPTIQSVSPALHPSTKNNLDIFTTSQWQALRLYFSLLDVNGTGVLLEESFVTLLAEQDSDAYATQDELQLLMDVVDCNGDGLITAQDFLHFAYRSFLRWKKNAAPRTSKTMITTPSSS